MIQGGPDLQLPLHNPCLYLRLMFFPCVSTALKSLARCLLISLYSQKTLQCFLAHTLLPFGNISASLNCFICIHCISKSFFSLFIDLISIFLQLKTIKRLLCGMISVLQKWSPSLVNSNTLFVLGFETLANWQLGSPCAVFLDGWYRNGPEIIFKLP